MLLKSSISNIKEIQARNTKSAIYDLCLTYKGGGGVGGLSRLPAYGFLLPPDRF